MVNKIINDYPSTIKTFDIITNIEILKEESSQDVYDNDTDMEIWKDWDGGYTSVEN